MTFERAIQLIQSSISSLRRSGLIDDDVVVADETVLLGTSSSLDSMAFVAFVTDLEDRLQRETGRDLSLVLGSIHDFNTGAAALRAGALAEYVVKLAGGN